MLYDPKWEVETKADPFSLASLIAWLEKQPPEKTYEYTSCSNCVVAQYIKSLGYVNLGVDYRGFYRGHSPRGWQDLPRTFNNTAVTKPWTFGAALERARKLAAS